MSTQQRMGALALANKVRLRRQTIKRSIKNGLLTIQDALVDPACQSMSVFELLCSQKQWGRVRAVRALSRLGIGEQRQVWNLTDRQRFLLRRACEPEELPRIPLRSSSIDRFEAEPIVAPSYAATGG